MKGRRLITPAPISRRHVRKRARWVAVRTSAAESAANARPYIDLAVSTWQTVEGRQQTTAALEPSPS